jgi:hypothetical protein
MDAGATVPHAGKAAGAVFDAPVNGMDDLHVLPRSFLHARQKGAGDVHGIALVPFGTSVQNQYLHVLSS